MRLIGFRKVCPRTWYVYESTILAERIKPICKLWLTPFDVAVYLVDAQSDQLGIKLTELRVELLERVELRRAHGGEVRRVAEEDEPFPLHRLGQLNFAVGGGYRHFWELVANQGHACAFHLCYLLRF